MAQAADSDEMMTLTTAMSKSVPKLTDTASQTQPAVLETTRRVSLMPVLGYEIGSAVLTDNGQGLVDIYSAACQGCGLAPRARVRGNPCIEWCGSRWLGPLGYF